MFDVPTVKKGSRKYIIQVMIVIAITSNMIHY